MVETLRGLIGHFQLADLLSLLRSGRQTGSLRVSHGPAESALFVREGFAVFGASSKPELRFGRLLVRQGRLSSAEVDALFGAGKPFAGAKSDRVGQMLVAERLLKQDELGPLLEAQTTEVFVDALSWKEGTFWFNENESAPDGVVQVHVDLQGIVMEAVRRLDEFGRLPEIFPNRAIVYRSKVNPDSLRQSVVLTMEEWQALFLLDGRRTLEDLCQVVADRDSLQTLDVVRRLLQGGFLEECELDTEQAGYEAPKTMSFSSGDYGEIPAVPQPPLPPPPPLPAPTPPTAAEAAAVADALLPGRSSESTHDGGATVAVSPETSKFGSAAMRASPWRLVIYEGRSTEPSIVTIGKEMTTIGRHMSNDLVFPANAVSGFHARIDRGDEGIEIVDLKSLNGTVVNGLPIAGPTALADGDEITIRPFRILVQFDVSSSASVIPVPKLR